MKKIKMCLCTYEAQRLFQVAIRIDKTIRKLAVFASRGLFPYHRYSHLITLIDDSIERYRQFLNSLYSKVEPTDPTDLSIPFQLQIGRYSKIISSIKTIGNAVSMTPSSSQGLSILKLVKQTDICIRIIEEYSKNNLTLVISLRKSVNDQINILDDAENGATNDLYSFQKSKNQNIRFAKKAQVNAIHNGRRVK